MNRSLLRVLFVVGVLALLALPASAQYPACKECWSYCYSDGSCATSCVDVMAEGWGWERCRFYQAGEVQLCRGAGTMCYYLEVEG